MLISCKPLAFREADLIVGVLFVPHTDEFFTGLADILAVDDVARKGSGDIQAVHMEQEEYDEERTKYLNSLGYKVIRFWNNEVTNNIDGVILAIIHAMEDEASFVE